LFERHGGRTRVSRAKPADACANGFDGRRHHTAAVHRRADGDKSLAAFHSKLLTTRAIPNDCPRLAPAIGPGRHASQNCRNDSRDHAKVEMIFSPPFQGGESFKSLAFHDMFGVVSSPVNFRQKTVRVCVFLFLVAGCAFVTDVLNPETPTPLVWPRVAALTQLLFAALRLLVPVGILIGHACLLPSHHLRESSARPFIVPDVRSLTCVQLI